MSHGKTACYIQRIGTAVPEQSVTMDRSVEVLRDGCINRRSHKLMERITRLTGVEKRHLVALDYQNGSESFYRSTEQQPHGPGMSARTAVFQEAAGPLVLRSLRTFQPAELERMAALVTVSCTHASSPGLERPIFENTCLPHNVDRWNLGFMGCSAGLAAMRLLSQLAPSRESLLVACELSSLHFQYTDKLDQMTANLLFADGAAAMSLSPEPSRARVVACRSVGVPAAAEQMVWFAGDHGLELKLAQELGETLASGLPAAVGQFLEEQGCSIGDIKHWLVHPGGPQILDAVQQCLRLPADALHLSREVLRTYGNMSSPTILFILKSLLETPAAGRVMAIAFGPGLTIEMVLLEVGSA